MPLAGILSEHVPADTTIDFMSIDVEGMDLEVLESSDWQRFRAALVAVEDLGLDLADVRSSPVFRFMTDVRYRFVAHAVYTSFYLRWDDEPQWIDIQRQEHDTRRPDTRNRPLGPAGPVGTLVPAGTAVAGAAAAARKGGGRPRNAGSARCGIGELALPERR